MCTGDRTKNQKDQKHCMTIRKKASKLKLRAVLAVLSTILIGILLNDFQCYRNSPDLETNDRKEKVDNVNAPHHVSTNGNEIHSKGAVTVNITKNELMQYSLYNHRGIYRSTIVIKKYKLLWVLIPKCASSSARELLARMSGQKVIPGITKYKDLQNFTSLHQFSPEEAIEILTDPDWTRVAILRDPKDRLLSAYLDKEEVYQHDRWKTKHHIVSYFKRVCCKHVKDMTSKECRDHKFNITEFVNIARVCHNGHWTPQKNLIPNWDIINYPIYMNNLANETERILRHLGDNVWDKFGATGWGENGTDAIFQQNTRHASNSTSKFNMYYNKELERIVEKDYVEDYNLIRQFFPGVHFKR